jgi:hypothetical protein
VEKLIDEYDAIIFCGDYADDWGKESEDSIKTWKRLYDFCNKYPDKVFAVCGNHDIIYIRKTPSLQSGYNQLTQFIVDVPANKYLKNWLLTLPITLEKDGITFSHAGISKGWNGKTDIDSLWQDNSPIWVRPGQAEYLQVPQVFGHSPQPTCTELHKDIWAVDTFCTFSDGTPIGDHTVLEINSKNGKRKYKKIKLNEPAR